MLLPRGHLWLHSMSVVFAAQQTPLVRAVEFDGSFQANASIVNDAFEKYVEEQMLRWQVPGIAMTVLEGKNTWMKGFGYANTNKDPVTTSTLFYCGSMTKSFTAAAMSQLVDEPHKYSNINWTSKVSHLLPEFVLSDEWATKHITVEDCLSHRTGYPTHDNTGLYGNSSERMVRNLRNLPMSYEPREKWQYSNIMYGTMGYLIERLTNTTLASYFRDRLWRPMGMNNTYLHPSDALAKGEALCQAFYWNNDTKEYGVVPWKDEHNVAAAGMTLSSVKDWSKYLRHLIEESGPISKAGHTAVKQPRMLGLPLPYFVGSIYYGFGWESTVFQNENIWWHSGLVDRMMSIMVIIPNRKFAFVIMMNASRQPALDSILMKALYDHFKVPDVERVDVAASWTSEVDEVVQRLQGCPAKLFPKAVKSKSKAPPPVILDNFVGVYHDKGYGNITLSKLCDWNNPGDSPAKLTLTQDRCVLSIKKQNVFNRELSYKLQHVAEDDWVAWYYDDDFATVRRPAQCYRANIPLDEKGIPKKLGLDIRMETDETPLVWFAKSHK